MKSEKYFINENHEFVIEDYNQAKPFSSFLPAIAGLNGKPMWVYYVNRGQCVSTFGVNNKDYSIMEFQPANKAYRQTSLQGFRTFLRIKDTATGTITFYEPFQDNLANKHYDVTQKMFITSYDLKLEEVNRTLGFKIEAMFCTLPGESLSSLVRKVTVTNISEKALEIEILDGMPVIIPYYLENIDLKEMSNLRQAWMGIEHADKIPFYRIKALPYDTPETVLIEGGNFFLNFDFVNGKTRISKTIIEPSAIFGNVTDQSYPANFVGESFEFPENQADVGYTPCGFGYKSFKLNKDEFDTTFTLIGNSAKYEKLESFADNTLTESYITGKIEENKTLIEKLKNHIFTSSSSEEFDLYCGQSFMDNFLRGGYPIKVGDGKHSFYVYSRKHGDLEREYNFFQVDSTYYSQGNSNFRDVNQNRRNDVYFFPFIEDSNVCTFFDLIQLDGFNPLVLMGSRFTVSDAKAAETIMNQFVEIKDIEKIKGFIEKPFNPGSFLNFLEQNEISMLNGDADELLNKLLSISKKEDLADFKEGYWVDHWTYNNDLLEQFIDVYPDKVADLLFNRNNFSFYDNYEVVLPRDKKYVLTDLGVRQFGSVGNVPEKKKMIKERTVYPFRVRTDYGKGEVYYCTLVAKITALLVNKIASFDSEGLGVEMESNKPGWCDALNGLPAIISSSINESTEVRRLAAILSTALNNIGTDEKSVKLPEEIVSFYNAVKELLCKNISDFEFWNQSNNIKEDYRSKVIFGISGKEAEISINDLKGFLTAIIEKADRGLSKAIDKETGVYYTYFINEVADYEILKDENGEIIKNSGGLPCVRALKFKQRPIPYFLEGPVHVMRMQKDTEKATKLHHSIKKTGLYDEKLDMYKVNDNIMEETKEIGRQNVFPRGWLENEAVFLHMEYKYFLELLRCGVYEDFFHCFKTALVPFLDPAVYGRSILENSSFIASSAHPDEKIHGTGFVSRLTGASAEFLNIWRYMTAGQRPFFMNENGELNLELHPVLPAWLFTTQPKLVEVFCGDKLAKIDLPANSFAFKLLGDTFTVYHNETRKDTFGAGGAVINKIELYCGENIVATINGSVIPQPYAQKVREGGFDKIEIYLG
jgi:hypothetical protein